MRRVAARRGGVPSRRLRRSFTNLHGCRNLCIPDQLPIPRNSEDATDGSKRASGQSLFISPTYPSRRLPRSFTYLHGCRNLCISHRLPIPRNSEEGTDGSNSPLAHRWRSRRLPRSLIHLPARLPQSVHPTSTSDTEEFRGCNRWQQPRLWPIAVHLAYFREA